MQSATKIKKSAEPALEEWERLAAKVQKANDELAAAVAKQQQKFDKACDPLLAARNEKTGPWLTRMATLAAEIEASLKAGISADGETIAVPRLETAGAVAEVKDGGKRQINPEEFFKAVPVGDRTEQFWSCFEVLIGKSEKYLPEALMKRLAKINHKFRVDIRRKQ
jgi:hypothetical protein